MMRIFCTLWCSIFALSGLYAQIAPAKGAQLNYNQVMLEHPFIRGADAYIIQVSQDTSDLSFKHHVKEVQDSFPASIVSNLKFGKSYIWRYAGIEKGKRQAWHGPYKFSIKPDPFLINQNTRLRVIKNDSAKQSGGLVAVDILHGIFDRKGNLVWFFPGFKSGPRKGLGTDDLFLTKAGTLTMLGNQNAEEFNLNGKLLWTPPPLSPNKTLRYMGNFDHHDFKRLPNGHYMVIAPEFVWKKIPPAYDINKLLAYTDSSRHFWGHTRSGAKSVSLPGEWLLKFDKTGNYVYMNMSDLIEYDKKNNIVWMWRVNDYVKDKDIFPAGGQFEPEAVRQEPHLNGFCTDAKDEYVYASLKNFSRIVKIDKKTGKVVHSWGRKMPSGEALEGDSFFRQQHAPIMLSNGDLAVFDNAEMRAREEPSSVRVISMPGNGKPSAIVWQYDCIFDSVMRQNKSPRGGNVEQMANNNFLVCEGGVNRIFEITQDKNIVWHALVERNTHNDSGWIRYPLYRAHYTSSLYPNYFTIETNEDTLMRRKTSFTLKIYNDGTDTDSYTVKVSSTSGNYKTDQHTAFVPGRHSTLLTLEPLHKPEAGEKIEVAVISDNNPDNERKAVVVYK